MAAVSGTSPPDRGHARLVVLVCAAQVLVQLGAFFWPALLPDMMRLWTLTNSQAGWITAIFYAAYMLSVPVLVTLTDRIDARRVYLFGVGCTVIGHGLFALADGFWPALGARALTGMGWAGTYMTGLKLLADKVDAKLLARATTGHAASIGISGALSFACAGLLTGIGGWPLAFVTAGGTALLAFLVVLVFVPRRQMPPRPTTGGSALFDFRPVLRNRSSMAYGLAYCVHTLEMNALRGWGVAFLGFVAVHTGTTAVVWSPVVIMTALGLLGTLASVLGNEAAIRLGRRRLIAFAMTGAIVMAAVLGVAGSWSYGLAVALLTLYTVIIWLDSSSLTAGAAGTADPAKRGATLAVHSMLGYAGGFIGPLAVGWTLDAAGGASPLGWGLAFALIAGFMGVALALFLWLRPRELAGDKGAR